VLLEVVFGAALILVVLTAVLMSMDVSTAASQLHRNRALAADLAQQDQERMRSMAITSLSNYHTTRDVSLSGTTYTVTSNADWVRDASGAVGCTADQTNADYLALTSSVRWPGMAPSTQPVVIEGLATPTPGAFNTGQGTAAVQVTDRGGLPVRGVDIALDVAPPLSNVTDANGCAVFANVTAGTYTLTGTAPGRVDMAGNSTFSMSAAVAARSTRLLAATYDTAATAVIAFDTQVGSTVLPASARSVRVSAPGLPSPGTRTFVPPVVPASTVTVGSLFPFTGGYAVYAGTCTSADPRRSPTLDATYFDSHPGQIQTDPGGAPTVTVRVPAINVHVRVLTGSTYTPVAGANVRVASTSSNCDTFPIQQTDATGALPLPGHPFGSYTLCVDDGNRHVVSGIAVANTNPAGTPVTTVTLPSTQSSSNCP
jgi:type II secretory pathway pseudopilin PulG